jgi:hypothetical protein
MLFSRLPLYFSLRDQSFYFLKLYKKQISIIMFILFGSITLSLILVSTDGSMNIAGAFLVLITIVFLSFFRLDWGFYIFIGMVLLFDQFHIPRFEPFTVKFQYFQNLKETYLAGFGPAVINPVELHLFLLFFVWLVLIAVKKDYKLNRIPVWVTSVFFFVWIGFSFVFGLIRGGDFLPALWELRALFYLGIMYYFVPQIIQSKEQVQTLMWVCIGVISFKAFQGIARFMRLGFSSYGAPTLTNHEDPLFFLGLIILLLGLVLFGVETKQRRVLKWLVLPLLMGFLVAQRRAQYGALAAAFVGFIVLLPSKERWRMLKVFLPVATVFGLYLFVFWDSTSNFGYTARIIKSGFSSDEEITGDRYYSNLYRDYEKYNLAVTVQHAPVLGIGFGKKYEMPLELARIPFTLRDYIPHNEILWLLVKTGAIGFFLFFLFLNSFLVHTASIFLHLKDPYLKAVCALAIIGVLGQIVVSYFDLQLTYYRNMIYLGMLMGLVTALEAMDEKSIGVVPVQKSIIKKFVE